MQWTNQALALLGEHSNPAIMAAAAPAFNSGLTKLSIDAVPLTGRRVLCRVDFNVPVKEVCLDVECPATAPSPGESSQYSHDAIACCVCLLASPISCPRQVQSCVFPAAAWKWGCVHHLTASDRFISQGVITNAQRIEAALPTIRYALDNGAKVSGCSLSAKDSSPRFSHLENHHIHAG